MLSPVDTNNDRLIERGRSKTIANTKTCNEYTKKVGEGLHKRVRGFKNSNMHTARDAKS